MEITHIGLVMINIDGYHECASGPKPILLVTCDSITKYEQIVMIFVVVVVILSKRFPLNCQTNVVEIWKE